MTDITTKLRSLARWLRQLATHEPEPECKASHIECSDDAEKAADEIDRLHAELDGYREANRYMKGELDDALEDARKYCEAQAEIARLREALDTLTLVVGLTAFKHEGQRAPLQEAMDQARAALAPVEAK